jgi:hypothetical protein
LTSGHLAGLGLAGAAVYGASNATGQDVASILTPSVPESFMFGAMASRHKGGFVSGGMIGYSTFFTGFNPEAGYGGTMRSISAGRAAAGALSLAARGMRAATTEGSDAYHFFNRFAGMHKYGLQGALMYQSEADFNKRMKPTLDKLKTRHRRAAISTLNTTIQSVKVASPSISTAAPLTPKVSSLVGVLDAADAKAAATTHKGADRLIGKHMKGPRNLLKGLSVFTGRGFDGKNVKGKWILDETGARRFVSDSGSKAAALGGAGGQMAGRLIRMGGWLQLGSMAATAAVDFAGDTYASMVRHTRHMQDKYNVHGNVLSPAYMSQAAVTERQRAQMELNTSILNPRTQMMGNEAGMYHR